MLREVREELDRIENFLMRGDQASADLAMILSALRGPDEEDHVLQDNLKTKYTTPLRGAVFPRLYERAEKWLSGHKTTKNLWGAFSPSYWGMESGEKLPIHTQERGHSHFISHIRLAIKAIQRQEIRSWGQ